MAYLIDMVNVVFCYCLSLSILSVCHNILLFVVGTGTYLETDLDRSVTRDISVQARGGTTHQMSSPSERRPTDMLYQPSHGVDRDWPMRSPDRTSGLTGGRYSAYRGHAAQPDERQLYRQGNYQQTALYVGSTELRYCS